VQEGNDIKTAHIGNGIMTDMIRMKSLVSIKLDIKGEK